MNAKEFSVALGNIRNEYVAEAVTYQHIRKNCDENIVKGAKTPIKKKLNWKVWGAMAACLCLILIAGIGFNIFKPDGFNTMIANSVTDTTVHYTFIDIEGKTATYHEVSIDDSKLEKYVGEQYQQDNAGIWYFPAGTNNLKYLLRQNSEGIISLWVFSDFVVDEGSSYTYGDVLNTIYQVNSADNFISITTTPSNSDNTAIGRAIQKEVGISNYTNRKDIETFYNIIVEVVCYGADSESKGNSSRFSYSFSTEEQDKLTSGESTYGTRFIKITLADGTTIDSWKYDALTGCFFEYGGIFTEPLSDEDVYKLNDIFGIK